MGENGTDIVSCLFANTVLSFGVLIHCQGGQLKIMVRVLLLHLSGALIWTAVRFYSS
jgi:hypothetical protein